MTDINIKLLNDDSLLSLMSEKPFFGINTRENSIYLVNILNIDDPSNDIDLRQLVKEALRTYRIAAKDQIRESEEDIIGRINFDQMYYTSVYRLRIAA